MINGQPEDARPYRDRDRDVSPVPPSRPMLLVLLAVVLLSVFVRARLVGVPLERDEGEYAYAGQLILDGTPPYQRVYNMKLPGVYAAYAVIMTGLGETREAIHLGLLLVNVATVIFLFLLGRRLGGTPVGALAAAAFAALSLSRTVKGIFANTEHFVVLFAVAGVWLLVGALEKRRSWWVGLAGASLGLGFLMKQHGAAFVAFGLLVVVYATTRSRPVDRRWLARAGGAYVLGAALLYGLTCALFAALGLFGEFWFWTVMYATMYVGSMPLAGGLERLGGTLPGILAATAPIWAFALVGLARALRDRKARFAAAFLVVSLLAVVPGFYFRAHYYVLALPGVSLAAASGIVSVLRWLESRPAARIVGPAALVLVFGYGFVYEHAFYFGATPREASRLAYGVNPFPEAIEVARYIRENTGPQDRVAVIGSEPQIYFYADRKAATGYIYTYALMESHPFAAKMQAEMMREIEEAAPRYLIYVNVYASWLMGPDSDLTILTWAKRFREAHYDRVGLIDIQSNTVTRTYWGIDAHGRVPRSNCWIEISRRRERDR